MNSLDKMEDYDRLARLCEAKDAQIAMQAEALNKIASGDVRHIQNGCKCQHNVYWYEDCEQCICDFAQLNLSVSAESVAAWRAKETEPLRREVAILHLSAEDRGIVINGLILERERSLQRKRVNSESCSDIMVDDCARLIKHFTDLNDTQATALTYDREVKAKALEEAADWYDEQDRIGNEAHSGQDELRCMAAELRELK